MWWWHLQYMNHYSKRGVKAGAAVGWLDLSHRLEELEMAAGG